MHMAVDLYIETLEKNFFFVMQKMAEFEVVTQELSQIQQIHMDLLELESFNDFVSGLAQMELQEPVLCRLYHDLWLGTDGTTGTCAVPTVSRPWRRLCHSQSVVDLPLDCFAGGVG